KIFEQEPINLLLIIKNWDGITLEGLLEDMKMIQYVKSIKKIAVVSDEKWVKADAKLENKLPGVQVVYYPPEEIQSANNWLYT
ncbi:STAS/SEC14 domain-containing protein, partial [Virgibacillus halodenitrificans]|nr:STAS/SEC14 domain-containing protein [Virgibacillus halodenitrificans]